MSQERNGVDVEGFFANLANRIRTSIQKLSVESRLWLLVWLFASGKLTEADIGQFMGMDRQKVRSHVAKARRAVALDVFATDDPQTLRYGASRRMFFSCVDRVAARMAVPQRARVATDPAPWSVRHGWERIVWRPVVGVAAVVLVAIAVVRGPFRESAPAAPTAPAPAAPTAPAPAAPTAPAPAAPTAPAPAAPTAPAPAAPTAPAPAAPTAPAPAAPTAPAPAAPTAPAPAAPTAPAPAAPTAPAPAAPTASAPAAPTAPAPAAPTAPAPAAPTAPAPAAPTAPAPAAPTAPAPAAPTAPAPAAPTAPAPAAPTASAPAAPTASGSGVRWRKKAVQAVSDRKTTVTG